MSEDMLEPGALKGARPVLRGAESSDTPPPTRLTTIILWLGLDVGGFGQTMTA